MYAAVVEGLPPEERARVDAELELPLGADVGSVNAAQAAWRASHGW